MTDSLPKYAGLRQLRERVSPNLSRRRVRSWAQAGLVRVAKTGPHRQSPALYLVKDVVDLLDRWAEGREPVSRLRGTAGRGGRGSLATGGGREVGTASGF